MRTSRLARTITALALIVVSLVPAGPVAADQTTTLGAIRVTGVVRLDAPPFRLDPRSPWLLGTWGARAPGMTTGQLLNPLIDPLAPWLVDERVRDVRHWRGGRFEGPLDLADPRVNGWLSMLWNSDVHRLSDASVAVHSVTVELETGGGTWVGVLSGTGDPVTRSFRIGGSLVGTGAHTGGTAILDIQTTEGGWRVDGLVVTGDLPPLEAFVR